MSRKRNKSHESLVHQVERKLKSKLAIGESKQQDKNIERERLSQKRKSDSKAMLTYEERITIHKIYAWDTFRSYLKHSCCFVKWCKTNYNCKTLEECRPYVNEWLKSRSELSAYTQKLEACALAKLFDCTTEAFIPTATRHRADITRSRKEAKRDKNYSDEKNQEFIDFCKATGLRMEELKCLRGNQLIYKNGLYYIGVSHGSKGGRYRESPIISNTDMVVNRMKNAGLGKVWTKVPDIDVHSYRSEYCSEIYHCFARSLENIPKKERYHCRRELKGTCYDKRAMLIASRCLGHNRINIIAAHYIR